MNISIRILSWFAVLLFSSSLSARNAFEEYVHQRMEFHEVVGTSIVRIEKGARLAPMNIGLESTETEVPISESSVFQVGSISKPVAAWVALTLVRDGKLSLDRPVNDYLSRWKIPESVFDTERVTLRRLLSHTAGLNLQAYAGFPENDVLPTLEQSLSGEASGTVAVSLFQGPGEGYSYSGGGYTVIQLLIEEASGVSFAEYAKHSVLAPLGMSSSSYAPEPELLARLIDPHGYSREPVSQRHFRAQAAASLHTTAGDLARFVLANMSDGSVLDGDVISLMHSPVASSGHAAVGLGFFIEGDGEGVGHGGSNLGWRAEVHFNPETMNGLVVLTNSDGTGGFLQDVKCYWDTQLKEPSLSRYCIDTADQLAKSTRLMNRIAWLIATLIAVIIILTIVAIITSRLKLVLPTTKWRVIGLLGVMGITLFYVSFIYTPLGAYLVTDFRSIFATVHYLPSALEIIVPWVCGVLILLWLPFFCRQTDNKKEIKKSC